MCKIYLFIFLCLSVQFALSFVAKDVIENLPGINFKINFKQYSGYLNIDNTSFLHYWLIELQSDPVKDPLLLWLNGGPCCSSVTDLFTLNGPFAVTNWNTTVYENVYGWNKVANVLYLESPTQVGFSYTTDPNTTYGDNQTALLNYNALKLFFKLYPEYNQRDFYISGFSYAGVYLPTLAMYLLNDPDILPHLKGVAIGNPYISNSSLLNTIVPFVYEHALVGEEFWQSTIKECCDGNAMACDYYSILDRKSKGESCFNKTLLLASMPFVLKLDIANLYETCYLYGSSIDRRVKIYEAYLNHMGVSLDMISSIAEEHGYSDYTVFGSDYQKLPDCAYSGVQNYLARLGVREAIHIPKFVQEWRDCSSVQAIYEWQHPDMSMQLKAIVAAKIPILIFNGDVDTICNVIGNQQFLASLNFKKINITRPWIYSGDKVKSAGMETRYEGLDFLTVRGGGHMSIFDRPRETLQMIANFIWSKNYSLPTGLNLAPQPLLATSGVESIIQKSLVRLVKVIFAVLFSSITSKFL